MYGQRVELNARGATSINTLYGSIISMIIYTVVCGYFLYRFQIMVTYGNTQVFQSTQTNYFNETSSFNFDLNNFKIAVGITPTSSLTNLLNQNYVEMVFRLRSYTNVNLYNDTILTTHICTQDDINQFSPVLD